jgi:hypothetical protein
MSHITAIELENVQSIGKRTRIEPKPITLLNGGVVVLFVQFGTRCTKKALHYSHLHFLWFWELRAFRADWCSSLS